jgi:hypothetical protein
MEAIYSSILSDTGLHVALQKQVLDSMSMQGAQVQQLMESAPTPPAIGSVSGPSQGHNVDAWA